MAWAWWCDRGWWWSCGQGAQGGDCGDGVGESVELAAVAVEDLVGLHAAHGVLDVDALAGEAGVEVTLDRDVTLTRFGGHLILGATASSSGRRAVPVMMAGAVTDTDRWSTQDGTRWHGVA